jgi:hypothetical protein
MPPSYACHCEATTFCVVRGLQILRGPRSIKAFACKALRSSRAPVATNRRWNRYAIFLSSLQRAHLREAKCQMGGAMK